MPDRMPVSRLGFGCASLGSKIGLRQGLRILEYALDLGITHFDVAPSYGRGLAESIIGRFAKARRDRLTICTKFGIEPSIRGPYLTPLIAVARVISVIAPTVRRRGFSQVPAVRLTNLAAEDLRQSVDRSLRALNTDYIDVLAYHECTLLTALRPEILYELDNLVHKGKIRLASIAASASVGKQILLLDSGERYRVLQCANSALDPQFGPGAVSPSRCDLVVTHSALGNGAGIHRISEQAKRSPEMTRRLAEMDVDLTSRAAVCRALLCYALATNPAGVVLTSTVDVTHLVTNVTVANEAELMPIAARRLLVKLALGGEDCDDGS